MGAFARADSGTIFADSPENHANFQEGGNVPTMKKNALATPSGAKEGEFRTDLRKIFGPEQLDQQLCLMVVNIFMGALNSPKRSQLGVKNDLFRYKIVQRAHYIYTRNATRMMSEASGRVVEQDGTMKIGAFAWCSLRRT